MSYTEWGQAAAQNSILCMHGLTRNGRDFDYLAQSLSANYRVICPDLAGRGASDRFANPHFYNQAQYATDLTTLIARMNVPALTWIGTSLGGILGMYMAAQPNTPIKALVLNDAGPLISKIGIERIRKYAKRDMKFANLAEAEQYFRNAYKTSEKITDEQWQHMAEHSVTKLPDGQYALAYDPHVAHGMHKWWITDINLWSLWDKVKCPVLVLRGETSDILLRETTDQMRVTGPKATITEIPACGHAPMLMTPEQIAIIHTWLGAIAIR
ncbi:MAG TPA: alpha/beta hydrolase [Gammaproteobacteria bacterium]|nr:alpha/beta hydrolase [Gammaproteobacteria bacterium]